MSTQGSASTSRGSALVCEPTKAIGQLRAARSLICCARRVAPIMLVVPEFGFWP